MNKYRPSILLAIVLFLCCVFPAQAATADISVTVDGEAISMDATPFIAQDRVLVPIRFVAEALGADVSWQAESMTATIDYLDTHITLRPGQTRADINGAQTSLEVAPMLHQDRLFVPLRFISEALQAEIDWREDSRSVIITTLPQDISALLTQQMSLLNQRLAVTMPEGSSDEAMYRYGIMGAPSTHDEETQLLWMHGNKGLLVYARELFRLSSGDLQQDVAHIYSNYDSFDYLSFGPLAGIEALEIIPHQPIYETAAGESSIFVRGALLRMPDDTLVSVHIYANEALLRARGYCDALAVRVLSSLQYGERQLDTAARTAQLSADRLMLDIPQGYVLTAQHGIDFSVYYCTKLVAVGEEAPYFALYSGWFPSYGGLEGDENARYEDDIILGQPVKWQRSNTAEGRERLDLLVLCGEEYDERRLHLFLSPADADMEELRTLARSLRYGTLEQE